VKLGIELERTDRPHALSVSLGKAAGPLPAGCRPGDPGMPMPRAPSPTGTAAYHQHRSESNSTIP
jgi:hypothetical protein